MNSKQEDKALVRFVKRHSALLAAAGCALLVGLTLILTTPEREAEPTTLAAIPQAADPVAQVETTTRATTAATFTTGSTTAASVPEAAGTTLVWPVKGTVLTAYATQHLIYDATLAQWSTHEGLDIQAEEGTEVGAAMAGRVESVREDKLTGRSVTLIHDGGWTTVYQGLSTIDVALGDVLEAGETLGTVGNTNASESALGPHLHFALYYQGDSRNPMDYLPEP